MEQRQRQHRAEERAFLRAAAEPSPEPGAIPVAESPWGEGVPGVAQHVEATPAAQPNAFGGLEDRGSSLDRQLRAQPQQRVQAAAQASPAQASPAQSRS